MLAARSREELLRRNEVFETFFEAEAPRLSRGLPRDVPPVPGRRAAPRFRRRVRRHRRPARLGGVRAPGDRRQAGVAGAGPGPGLRGASAGGPAAGGHGDGLRFPGRGRGGGAGARGGARAGRDDVRPHGGGGRILVRPAGRGSVRRPGGLRGPLPRALGDGARVLRAPRAGPRRRRFFVPVPDSWAGGSRTLEGVVEEVQGSMLQKMEEVNAMRAADGRSGGGSHLGGGRGHRRSGWVGAARSSPSATAGRPRTRTTWSPTAWTRRRA